MALDLKAKIAATPRGPAYGLSTTVDAPELPERAGALPTRLQDIALSYISARQRAGDSLLEMARWMSEARQEAVRGEWYVFLEATNTSANNAESLLAIHARVTNDPLFATAMRSNFLSLSAGYELLSAPPDIQERLLRSEQPITRKQIRAEKEAAKPHAGVGFDEQSVLPVMPPATPTPDLADILLRLDAHGYAKTSTREKGITTFYSFRDYSGRSDETGGEVELAEGELPIWLTELDSHAAYAQAKQERYLDAQARYTTVGWRFERDGAGFVAIDPKGSRYGAPSLDLHIRRLEGLESIAAKQAKPPLSPLSPEQLVADERLREAIVSLLGQAQNAGERTGTALYQQAYNHAREIHDLALHNKMIALIDRATDVLPTDAVTPFAAPPDPAHVAALEEQIESGDRIPEARMVVDSDLDTSDRAAYEQKEQRDAGRLERAHHFINAGEYDAARTVLGGIEVSTYARDQLLRTIPRGLAITLEFTTEECAALLKEARLFSNSDLTRQTPTIGQTLILMVEAIKGMPQPARDPVS